MWDLLWSPARHLGSSHGGGAALAAGATAGTRRRCQQGAGRFPRPAYHCKDDGPIFLRARTQTDLRYVLCSYSRMWVFHLWPSTECRFADLAQYLEMESKFNSWEDLLKTWVAAKGVNVKAWFEGLRFFGLVRDCWLYDSFVCIYSLQPWHMREPQKRCAPVILYPERSQARGWGLACNRAKINPNEPT